MKLAKKRMLKEMYDMRYKAAIFDMDGTILNTLEDLTDSTNYALAHHGFPERTIDEVRRFVGNGIRKLIERAVPAGTDVATIDKVFDTFASYYKEHSAIKTRPYDGIHDAIAKLRAAGVKTAVVSNKADFAVQDLCVDYFPGMFDFALGEKSGIAKQSRHLTWWRSASERLVLRRRMSYI